MGERTLSQAELRTHILTRPHHHPRLPRTQRLLTCLPPIWCGQQSSRRRNHKSPRCSCAHWHAPPCCSCFYGVMMWWYLCFSCDGVFVSSCWLLLRISVSRNYFFSWSDLLLYTFRCFSFCYPAWRVSPLWICVLYVRSERFVISNKCINPILSVFEQVN